VEKIVRVINPSNNDSWALMSLCNVNGQNIELKFVDRMKRQFQFSVDSFQILIDPLLDYYEQVSKYQQQINKKQQYHRYYGKYQLVGGITNNSCTPLFNERENKIRSHLLFRPHTVNKMSRRTRI
jgi:hypothetical protein